MGTVPRQESVSNGSMQSAVDRNHSDWVSRVYAGGSKAELVPTSFRGKFAAYGIYHYFYY